MGITVYCDCWGLMDMARMVPLNAKVSLEFREKLQQLAMEQDVSYSEYVRELLERKIEKEDHLSALIRLLEASDFDKTKSVLVELLLLMRVVAGADKQRTVKAQLIRLGIEPWSNSDE